MEPVLDLLVAVGLMVAGMGVGWHARRAWPVVYGLGLGGAITVAFVTRWPELTEHPFLSWAAALQWRSWMASMVIPALLLAPTHPLERVRRVRILWAACAMAMATGLGPVASAWQVSSVLLSNTTRIGSDGVCRQQTDFTCGPAAAVTALHQFGVLADEGALAMRAGTTPLTGTTPEALARALRREHGDAGLEFDLRQYESIEDLPAVGVSMVVVKYGFMLDHWVCVLRVTPEGVEVADPSAGIEVWPAEEFMQRWKKVGIEVRRKARGG